MQIRSNNSKSVERKTWLKLTFKPIFLTLPTAEVLRPERVSQCGRQGSTLTFHSHWPRHSFQKLTKLGIGEPDFKAQELEEKCVYHGFASML